MPFTKITIPMIIKIVPPKIVAFPASFVPNFLPSNTPVIHIPNVTTDIINEQTKEPNQLYPSSTKVKLTYRASIDVAMPCTNNTLKVK